MKALYFQGGRPIVADVSPPGPASGRIEVEVHYSAVSPGTERGLLEGSGRSMLAVALEKRRRVDRLWGTLRKGDLVDLRARFHRLAERSQAWIAPGYSAAGIVRAVGASVDRFAPGDRVAVAGAGYAAHAELMSVPVNLSVPVPTGLELRDAATVALGAIALQSVRRADARLGETVFVLGLGMIGQLVTRTLLAGGCRVLAWDPQRTRGELAAASGAEMLPVEQLGDVAHAVTRLTGGQGADRVIIAAAAGAAATETGGRAARRGGTLVLLGDTPVQVERGTAYERELTIRLSTSYGPGRYDPSYEEEGHDYPYAHVRWTENRNMSAWLDLVAAGRVRVADLVHAVRDLDEAAAAYLALRQGTLSSLGLVFRYPAAERAPELRVGGGESGAPRTPGMKTSTHAAPPPASAATREPQPPVEPSPRPRVAAPLRVAMLGTGDYAGGVILPALAHFGGDVRLELLAGTVPARREPLAQRFGFARTVASYEDAAVDPAIDLVVIATRHDRHADLVVRALEAGRAVFCEKPLALTLVDLERLTGAITPMAFLALGFNRRCAPAVERLRAELASRRGPLQIAYRVQAGPLPPEHWIRGAEGGGRLIGEAVHMVDLCRYLIDAPLEVAGVMPGGAGADGQPASDNFNIALRYTDGSTATILYTSRGAESHPKESIEIHGDGRSFEIDNFAALRESGRRAPLWAAGAPDKGQRVLWQACVRALLEGRGTPTPAAEILETSRAVIALEQARRSA